MLRKLLSLLVFIPTVAYSQVIISPSRSSGTGGGGSGNVSGPATSTDGGFTCWDGTNGQLLKDCGALTSIHVTNTGLTIDDTDASHVLTIKPGSNLTANRTLTISTGDVNRALVLTADTQVGGINTGDVSLSGTPNYITISGQTITRSLVDLTSHVTGDLPFSNLTQCAGLSVLGVTSNSTADLGCITAGSDGQVLRRSGTTISFGSVLFSSLSSTPTTLSGYGITDALIFRTISVSGQSDVIADNSSDVLTIVGGTGITVTTNAGTDTITITSSGGAGTGDVVGPSSAVDLHVAVFDGVTGKLIKDGGVLPNFNPPGSDTLMGWKNSSLIPLAITPSSDFTLSVAADPGSLTLSGTMGGVDLLTTSNTKTITGKTINAASNSITFPVTWSFGIAGCQATVAGQSFNTQATGGVTTACFGTTITGATVDFPDDGSTVIEGQFEFDISPDWDGSSIIFTGYWLTTATSGNAIFHISGKCAGDNVAIPTTYNSSDDSVTEAAKGSASFQNSWTITATAASNHPFSSCSAGDHFYGRLWRDPSGSDTLGAKASILSFNVTQSLNK